MQEMIIIAGTTLSVLLVIYILVAIGMGLTWPIWIWLLS